MPGPTKLLEILLRIGGATMLLAFPMALLPMATMASAHETLGLGAFPSPATPLVEYLARSASLLYGFHGGLLLAVSRDVHRFAPIIRYLGGMNILFGIAVFAIDLAVGLPTLWTWGEGPAVLLTGVFMLLLVRRAEAEPREADASKP